MRLAKFVVTPKDSGGGGAGKFAEVSVVRWAWQQIAMEKGRSANSENLKASVESESQKKVLENFKY